MAITTSLLWADFAHNSSKTRKKREDVKEPEIWLVYINMVSFYKILLTLGDNLARQKDNFYYKFQANVTERAIGEIC